MRRSLKPEEALQRSFAEYLDWASLGKRWRWFHVPNGGKMTERRGYRLKKIGVKAGCPDILIQRPNGCVEIELKSGYNKQTPAQIEWEKRSRELGIPYYVCRNLSELQSALEREKLI